MFSPVLVHTHTHIYIYIYIYIGIYVCEQLPGAKSSPIVTKLHQSYPWPQGDEVITFWKVKGLGRRERYAPY